MQIRLLLSCTDIFTIFIKRFNMVQSNIISCMCLEFKDTFLSNSYYAINVIKSSNFQIRCMFVTAPFKLTMVLIAKSILFWYNYTRRICWRSIANRARLKKTHNIAASDKQCRAFTGNVLVLVLLPWNIKFLFKYRLERTRGNFLLL